MNLPLLRASSAVVQHLRVRRPLDPARQTCSQEQLSQQLIDCQFSCCHQMYLRIAHLIQFFNNLKCPMIQLFQLMMRSNHSPDSLIACNGLNNFFLRFLVPCEFSPIQQKPAQLQSASRRMSKPRSSKFPKNFLQIANGAFAGHVRMPESSKKLHALLNLQKHHSLLLAAGSFTPMLTPNYRSLLKLQRFLLERRKPGLVLSIGIIHNIWALWVLPAQLPQTVWLRKQMW